MRIQSIKMGNFKSYKDVGMSEELVFSPEANVLVGSNGSGKSNFFIALQFVLGHGDYSKTLSKELRRSLLHSGADNALSAFVEITLDNSGGRMSLDTDSTEVRIRRTIGPKTDEWRVNDNKTPASEVAAMLEAAGLSPSNPHYIVKQGQITRFGAMKDADRFDLLKEVAGTKVYEMRRARSLETIATADRDLDETKSNVGELDERLLKLSEEREEFKKFRDVENHHKCLLYALYKKTCDGAGADLKKLEDQLEGTDKKANAAVEELYEENQKLKQFERDAGAATVSIQQAKRQRDVLLSERTGWVKRLARAQVTVNTEVAATKDRSSQLKSAGDALEAVKKQIQGKQDELQALAKTNMAKQLEMSREEQELSELESRVNFLITKRGRSNQFSNQAERDKWLHQQIESQRGTVKGYEGGLQKLQAELLNIPAEITALKKKMEDKRRGLTKGKEQNDTRLSEMEGLTKQRDKLAHRRRELFQEQARVQQALDQNTEKEQALLQKVGRSMPRDIQEGRRSVEKAIAHGKIEGVYGPVVSLFKTAKDLHTCCDVMAANSLFHIVVDTNQTASRILRIINQQKLPGRPSFYPLNRITARAKHLPTEDDCFPLYDKLSFEPEFAPVMADLFGRVLVCKNLSVASAKSRTHNCDCVLTNGDKVDARGGIAGGYLGDKVSRMGAAAELLDVQLASVELKQQLRAIAEAAAEVDQEMAVVRGKLQELEERAIDFSRNRERESYDVRAFEADKPRLDHKLKKCEQDVQHQERIIAEVNATIKEYEAELKTTMTATLSDAEAQQLQDGQLKLDEKKKAFSTRAADLESHKSKARDLSNQLELNLLKRQAELQARVSSLANRQDDKQVTDTRHAHDVELIKQRVVTLDTEVKDSEKTIDANTKRRTECQKEGEACRGRLKRLQSKAGSERSGLDEKKRARATLIEKRDSAVEQIRKLGALPQGVEEYEHRVDSMTTAEIQKEIADAKQKLKAMSHVNRKAYDQFTQLSDARERLQKNLDERINEKSLLERLIEDLDAQKDEAVLRTFKGVKKGFADAFAELVDRPEARGELVLHRKESGSSGKLVEEFAGVGVKVNFGAGEGVVVDISPLSGGQKSVVALALIFAIQSCDPAPFYVFDEIDAALDPQFRAAVARKLQASSKDAQYLLVSFKEEMVSIGHRHFYIDFKNKASILRECTMEEAGQVLRTEEARLEARSAKRKREEEVEEFPTQAF
eukprot:TRINITY_DN6646_c1_g2_i1.p1 TRINITY_DN6646_c1_g2~~TRINITY_DN6646_c1_g2_i1.p1  ORF type:complete len:1221 (+),score=552.80 TRINITY_DN6646_c1_g2_i1:60-3722(+)